MEKPQPSAYQFKVKWNAAMDFNNSTEFIFTTISKNKNSCGNLKNIGTFSSFKAIIKDTTKNIYVLQIWPNQDETLPPSEHNIKNEDVRIIKNLIFQIDTVQMRDYFFTQNLTPTNTRWQQWLALYDTLARLINEHFKEKIEIYLLQPEPQKLAVIAEEPTKIVTEEPISPPSSPLPSTQEITQVTEQFKESSIISGTEKTVEPAEQKQITPPQLINPEVIKSKEPAKDVLEEKQKSAPPDQRSFFRPQKTLEKTLPRIEEFAPLILQQPLTASETEEFIMLPEKFIAQPITQPPQLIQLAPEITTFLHAPPAPIEPEPQPEPQPEAPVKTIDSAMFTEITLSLDNPDQEIMSFYIANAGEKMIGTAKFLNIKKCGIKLTKYPQDNKYLLDLDMEYENRYTTQEPVNAHAEIDAISWDAIKEAFDQIVGTKNIINRPIEYNESEWELRNLYNTLAALVNEKFKEKKIIIFTLSPEAEEQSAIPEALKKYQKKATEKELQRREGPSYGSMLKSVGAGASLGLVPMVASLVGEEVAFAHYNREMLKSTPALATAGALAGLAYTYGKHHIFKTPPGWEAQLKSLNATNTSPNSVSILENTYILAKDFDAIGAAGYNDNDNKIAGSRHYEIYLMPAHQFLFELFTDIRRKLLFLKDKSLKDTIAFIALRPTPRVYDTYNLTDLLSRKVLPRIVIAFKSSVPLEEQKKAAENLILLIRSTRWRQMESSGYQPWGSKKITDLIFAGLGSLNYKKLHPAVFKAQPTLFNVRTWLNAVWSSKGEMAYPLGQEKKLELHLISGVK
jgi:hypothetical protein